MTFAEKLDLARTISGFATPLVVLGLGFLLNHRLKNIENAQWHNRTIISKRIDIYDQIAPDLNALYCFFRFVGYWKDISPQIALEKKRILDKQVNIYRHLLSDDFFNAYNTFIHKCFETYTGTGKDALIRSDISNGWGDRRSHSNYEWKFIWDSQFSKDAIPEIDEFDAPYHKVMTELKECIGLEMTH